MIHIDDTSKYQDKKERKVWENKDDMECSLALCATKKQNLWHVNSGCSKHVIGDPNKFISLKRNQKGKVTFGNNLSSKIIGKGTVAIRDKMKAENVLLVKNLKPNL